MPTAKTYVQDEGGFLNRTKNVPLWIKAGNVAARAEKGIFKRLRASQGSETSSGYNSNLKGVDLSDLETRNEILDIDSLLQFPGDLGVNPRFNHFMLFNIYKGTSDRLDVAMRDKLGAFSVINREGLGNTTFDDVSIKELAKFGNADIATTNRVAVIMTNRNGVPPTQEELDEYIDSHTSEVAAIQTVYDGLYASNADQIEEYKKLSGSGQEIPQEYTTPIFSQVYSSGEILDSAVGVGGKLFNEGVSVFGGMDSVAKATENLDKAYVKFGEAAGKEWDKYKRVLSNKTSPNPANPNQIDSRRKKTNKDNYGILSSQRRFTQAEIRSKDTIALYMPQNVNHADGVGYSSEQLYAANLIIAAAQGQQGALSGVFNRFTRGFLDQLGKFTGKFIGTDINADALLAAKERAVPNPRRELIITEPNARSFTYTFAMYPKNAQESETIADIIQMFRYHQYPKLEPSGGHFLMFPSEFEIEYYMLQELQDTSGSSGLQAVRNGFMPKIGRCALKDVGVNYTPNDIWQSIGKDGAPNGVILTLTFDEMQPLNQEHIVEGY